MEVERCIGFKICPKLKMLVAFLIDRDKKEVGCLESRSTVFLREVVAVDPKEEVGSLSLGEKDKRPLKFEFQKVLMKEEVATKSRIKWLNEEYLSNKYFYKIVC